MCNATKCIIAVQGHFRVNQIKVVDFGTNRKRVFDFLLVINSNLCCMLHHFGDTAAYRSKIAILYLPTLIQRPRSG